MYQYKANCLIYVKAFVVVGRITHLYGLRNFKKSTYKDCDLLFLILKALYIVSCPWQQLGHAPIGNVLITSLLIGLVADMEIFTAILVIDTMLYELILLLIVCVANTIVALQ